MLLISLISLVVAFSLLIPATSARSKGIATLSGVAISSVISGFFSIKSLLGNSYHEQINMGVVLGNVDLVIDPLSAWFILLMNFTVITSVVYATGYLRHAPSSTRMLNMHWISILINQFSLTLVFAFQNTLAFLLAWELMAVSAFVLVVFDHQKMETIRAGVNFLIQAHISALLLTVPFIWIWSQTGNISFSGLSTFFAESEIGPAMLVFILFFFGFGIKAGFIPLHTWLPYAHPAAPAHISGSMSGVMIKTGIYGILRIMLLSNNHWLAMGLVVLAAGMVSSVYGVMQAIVQHNLKRLLAYHSIENIGIIGIGIGLGAVGTGTDNQLLAWAGFSGGMLHVLNHSLFKSLLFYGAGVVYQVRHTLQIDKLGGLMKTIPATGALFLIASMAISGLPPFNGFISEFLIYYGLFGSLNNHSFAFTALFILAIIALVLTGGLAVFCFAKAFGIVFLGSPRANNVAKPMLPAKSQTGAMVAAVIPIVAIGLMPQQVTLVLRRVTTMFVASPVSPDFFKMVDVMQNISFASLALFVIAILLWFFRLKLQKKESIENRETWGCGWQNSEYKMQYTASSFAHSYRKLIEPLLLIKRYRPAGDSLLPKPAGFSTHLADRLEISLVNTPVRKIKAILGRFNFLQNGSIQFYILYGIIFMTMILIIPYLFEGIRFISELIKQI